MLIIFYLTKDNSYHEIIKQNNSYQLSCENIDNSFNSQLKSKSIKVKDND